MKGLLNQIILQNILTTRLKSSIIYLLEYREMEQLAARRAHNPEVVGSSPTLATNNIKCLQVSANAFFINFFKGK